MQRVGCDAILSIRGYTSPVAVAMVNERCFDQYSLGYGTPESPFLQALDVY